MMQHIKNCRVSLITNCWRVKFGKDLYAILPAHVATYKSHNKWILSPFLKECGDEHLSWNIPVRWKDRMQFHDDFAWAKLIDNDKKSPHKTHLLETTKDLSEPIDTNFYYNQPYDAYGLRTDVATFGKMIGITYPSPNSSLLESLNIGHRGFSGAICVDNTIGLVGMFIGRGTELGQNEDASPLVNNTSPMRRGIIIPPSIMLEHIKEGGIQIT